MEKIFGLDDYQAMCLRTCPPITNGVNMVLGLCGETGEIADIVKKVEFHGHPLDKATLNKIKLELGDVLWYVAMMSKHLDLKLSDVATSNQEKLENRYPDGFSPEKSINRKPEDA